MNDYITQIVGTVIVALSSGLTWLVRTVLTNQKQMTLLKQEISERDVRRQEDRELMKELKDDVKEIKRDILDIYKKD